MAAAGTRLVRVTDAVYAAVTGHVNWTLVTGDDDRVLLIDAGYPGDRAAVLAASDCVYVASPPASHLDHATAVLDAGKAAFLEKPLAVDPEAAGRYVGRLAALSGRAAVNFPFASSLAV
ncbi:MAG TPA: Gfo/Idh/MocA family oxidoreductase, partial [Mycolicibacterium fallax]|nr:Gfo/Idh/MocA family oxidoreductase [Mycolicibacterium fallax]